MSKPNPRYWPSARLFTEAIQCPGVSFSNHLLRETLPAVDRLGMPLVTSGQFAYVYKLKSRNAGCDFAVRCFRSYLGDREQRYKLIHQHLQTYPLPFLSGFTYAPEGILVGGQRFPILFMKWIEGPTLDLYLDEMIGRPEVLLHLAEEWVKVVGQMRATGIAHGDLQHGNIIVEHGRLRLVDHDGMFVPQMDGWVASELGHQHFQHPRREARLFDQKLDNFSALVIYLSLISLAEQPALWAEHHDENLIFKKADFVNPAASKLFAQIKELGEEHRRLADILAAAATDEPTAAPYLLDLIDTKSALPTWLNSPLELEAKTKTREVMQAALILQEQDSRWIPWQSKTASSSLPATPPSSTVQTLFGGTGKANPNSVLANIRDPHAVPANTLLFAREFGRTNAIWWWVGVYYFLGLFDLGFFFSSLVALASVAYGCLVYGFIHATRVARAAMQQAVPSVPSPPAYATSPAPIPAYISWKKNATQHSNPASITTSNPIIGNRMLNIYHLLDCDWVKQILPKNRASFPSPAEALSAGYKPCRICLPSH